MSILLGAFMTCGWVEGKNGPCYPAGDTVSAEGYLMGQWGARICGLAYRLIGIFYL